MKGEGANGHVCVCVDVVCVLFQDNLGGVVRAGKEKKKGKKGAEGVQGGGAIETRNTEHL